MAEDASPGPPSPICCRDLIQAPLTTCNSERFLQRLSDHGAQKALGEYGQELNPVEHRILQPHVARRCAKTLRLRSYSCAAQGLPRAAAGQQDELTQDLKARPSVILRTRVPT